MKNNKQIFILFIISLLYSQPNCENTYSLPWGEVCGEYCGVVAYSNGSTGYLGPYGDYGYRYQCVEYINRFYVDAFGHYNMRGTGNANVYYSTAESRGLNSFPNGGTTCPQVGDIICSNGGTYGHVAIVRQVDWSTVHIIQQNWYNDVRDEDMILTLDRSGGHYTVGNFNSSYPVQGWLRKPGISDTEWNFYDGRDGWVVDDASTILGIAHFSDAPDGAIMLDPGEFDPKMWSPSGLYIDPTIETGYTNVCIRMASNCNDLYVQLFYTTTAEPYFTEEKSKGFYLPSSGPWYEHCIDMSDKLSWTNGGRITRLRLDPASDGDPGTDYDEIGIDYIRLLTDLEVRERKIPAIASLKISPNPFNSSCKITLDGAEIFHGTPSQINIYDLNGKCMETLFMRGTNYVWKPSEKIANGIYFIRATIDGKTITERILLMR